MNTTRSRFFGPLFPDVWGVPGRVFFGPLFPDPGPALTDVIPTEPAGVATFALDLEDGLTVTFEWQTDIFKPESGAEQRRAILESPRRRFAGDVLLIGSSSVLATRTQLARFAAAGQTFALALPYESLRLTADAVGSSLTVGVGALSACDWANPGQRVVVVASDRTALPAIIQSASGTSIVLDIAPGAAGRAGGRILPLVAIHLDPQQSFVRHRNPTPIERWRIDANAAGFGFVKQAVAARLDLETVTGGGGLESVDVIARVPGIAGNDIRVSLQGDSLSGIDFVELGNDIAISFVPGVSTVGDLAAAVNANSSLVKMIGTWSPTQLIEDPDDVFPLAGLDGGADGDYAVDGTGAVVVTHAGRPVFDRTLGNADTNDDPLQAMNEIVSLGATPTNLGAAEVSDWGRAVVLEAKLGPEWQWCKRFLSTVFGACVEFWLPTWRRDLLPVSSGVGALTIDGPADVDGGFFTWYPRRRHIQIRQVDGTITYATITDAIDNGDGTIALTITETLSGSPIDMVSWLELCRFESDTFPIRFTAANFALQTIARAVAQ